MKRHLIVNADDFGLSNGVNRGIIEAHEQGIVTSASLMVRQPAAAGAAAYAKQSDKLSVGLHVDLGEWVYRNGEWVPLYTVVATDDAEAVAREVQAQLDDFKRLTGRTPTHLDSHQHVHRQEPPRSILMGHAARLAIPLRQHAFGIYYCGDFYGQTGEGEPLPNALTVDALKSILLSLPPGVTELGCHPGHDDGLATPYRAERAREVEALCSPGLREFLARLNIELSSFRDLPPHLVALAEEKYSQE